MRCRIHICHIVEVVFPAIGKSIMLFRKPQGQVYDGITSLISTVAERYVIRDKGRSVISCRRCGAPIDSITVNKAGFQVCPYCNSVISEGVLFDEIHEGKKRPD